MRKRKAWSLAGLAVALLAAPAFSHHSFAVFDQSKLVSMAGTVKEFELVNPHAWLHLNIVNDKGDMSTWSFEAGSPTQLVKLGWSKDTFKVGDKVEVVCNPGRSVDAHRGRLVSIKRPADGWTWGSRASYSFFKRAITDCGRNLIDTTRNVLTGNERLEDRGSAYFLIRKD